MNSYKNELLESIFRDFSGGPGVKNLPSNAGDMDSIPGWGTKIPLVKGQISPHSATVEPTCSEACTPQLEGNLEHWRVLALHVKIWNATTKILPQLRSNASNNKLIFFKKKHFQYINQKIISHANKAPFFPYPFTNLMPNGDSACPCKLPPCSRCATV